jgi:hypothetical protein
VIAQAVASLAPAFPSMDVAWNPAPYGGNFNSVCDIVDRAGHRRGRNGQFTESCLVVSLRRIPRHGYVGAVPVYLAEHPVDD